MTRCLKTSRLFLCTNFKCQVL